MKRISLLVVLLSFTFAPVALALDTHTRPVSPVRAWSEQDLKRFDPAWVHVKFVEGANVELAPGQFSDGSREDMRAVNDALAAEAVTAIRRTFAHERATLRAWKAAGEERTGRPGPDLSLWFDVRVDGGRAAVARLLDRLNACVAVEIAHPAAIAELATIAGVAAGNGASARAGAGMTAVFTSGPQGLARRNSTPDFTTQQGYLYAPPVGLDALAAWAIPGGFGDGLKFIDVELSWCENHEDFDFSHNFCLGGAPENPSVDFQNHGTAVLGEIIGQHNGYGVNGFAPAVSYGMVAVDINEWPNVPHRFQEAVDHLDAGDVWLIELQMYPPGCSATPMEWLQVNYDVIWTSCWSLGIVCVEAGANGSQDLDDPTWGGVFDRNVRDSGAIMVAAGTPNGRVAEWFTNYGSRMDAHAWGSTIVTTGYGDLYNGGTPQSWYTAGFSGTSGASPMVTGTALCLQGIADANLSYRLDPIELRALITATGVPHLDPSKEIGPRPDLAAAAEQVLSFSGMREPQVSSLLPATRQLSGAPNPFRAGTDIRFTLPAPDQTRLVILDASGRVVRTLVDGATLAGEQRLGWDGRDDAGADAGSGVFLLHLTSGGSEFTGRLERIR
jgi:serine protease